MRPLVRLALNRRLFLALFEFEAHLALYPPGAFYRRHVDSFRGAANRMVSLVVYLNRAWHPGDGGELVLYRPQTAEEMVRIAPCAGTLLLFMSEEIEHEVLPTCTDRASIAGWFRLNPTLVTTLPTAEPPGPASKAFCSVSHPHRTVEYASGALGRETPRPQDLSAPRYDTMVNKMG